MLDLAAALGFVASALGAGALLLRMSRDPKAEELEHIGGEVLRRYAKGDLDHGLALLRDYTLKGDAYASIAHFYIALGYYWFGRLHEAEQALVTVDQWAGLLEIFPSRVLAAYLRAEQSALRGQSVDAEVRLAEAHRFATRHVRQWAAPLFMTEALLHSVHGDAEAFAHAVKQLDQSQVGPMRIRVLQILSVQFLDPSLRDAGQIERTLADAKFLEPNPLLDEAVRYRPELRALLAPYDATGRRFAPIVDGR